MTEPLVWLPFSPESLGEVPAGLRYEVVLPKPSEPLPDSRSDVEFYVLPYRFASGDTDFLGELPRLRVVQALTAGVDQVRPKMPGGVTLCTARGVHGTSTAELALTLILSSLRGIPDFVRAHDREEWAHGPRPALADKRVMIVGYGDIGAAIEARLTPFEVEVVRVARTPRDGVHPVSALPDLLPSADVVVLILPLTDDTRHLVDEAFLSRMKEGALLVNVARGGVVDTDALVAALHTGRISAALDVTDPEPLPPGHALWRTPNTLISPHVGGPSSAFWPRAHRLVREQLTRFAAGEPLANIVTD